MITGYSLAVDNDYLSQINGSLAFSGTSFAVDSNPYQASMESIVTAGYTYLPGNETFVEGQILGEDSTSDPALILWDSTYMGGYLDGTTYRDGTYVVRNYDPIWLNYSIWFLSPPDSSEAILDGYRYREPVHEDVGRYYASMEVPNQPGKYEIRWLYQKDSSSYAWEVIQPFYVESAGLNPTPIYT